MADPIPWFEQENIIQTFCRQELHEFMIYNQQLLNLNYKAPIQTRNININDNIICNLVYKELFWYLLLNSLNFDIVGGGNFFPLF